MNSRRWVSGRVGDPLRLDLLVEDVLVVEVKATSEHHKVFESQLLTYLRLSNLQLGLLLNFGLPALKEGIHRIANNRFRSQTVTSVPQ
jgi:GxxExxY protein